MRISTARQQALAINCENEWLGLVLKDLKNTPVNRGTDPEHRAINATAKDIFCPYARE
jgi:hypothetical protein